ncbi:MAG: TonB-dependent receptor [Bacteroidota bacterium]|nr:TonB-dependent receptor [Bacteroidota bacterium]MDP4244657.1 TonB-dependent receptor [Bacteroidota bacterium]MDP4256910.1 TonB-dependent receptor [Bacteroidota bacterium]
MKYFLVCCLLAAVRIAAAQTGAAGFIHPKGEIIDSLTGQPLAGATVEISPGGSVQTNEAGTFLFPRMRAGTYTIRVSHVDYASFQGRMFLAEGSGIRILLQRIQLFMQPVEVRALRAGALAPFTKTDLSKRQIEQSNLGQDLPYLLDQTPSVVINSDAGNGVGYTGIHLRGTDDSRINMTLNGIPYNDPEEQTLFFVDLPDLASSVNSIQIQRGVGTSSNGAGAFGASINFSTNEFNDKAYAEFNNSYGSFNTWKSTVKAGSGLIDDHFTIDLRASRISSDGYIDRAFSNLRSLYLSTAWYGHRSSLRFNLLLGDEKTYQAWNGIPEAKLSGNAAALQQHYGDNAGSLYFTAQDSANLFQSSNRKYNYFTYKDQTDNYLQNHYQLFFNHQFSPGLALNTAAFLTRGLGYYQEYHDQGDSSNAKYVNYGLQPYIVGADTLQSTDLIRQRWLDNYFYGGIFSLQYKGGPTQFTIGGGWDHFYNKHYGRVVWAANGGFPDDYRYYYEPAYKTDYNVYTKLQEQISAHWTAFADLQYRGIDYRIDGFDDNPGLFVHTPYHFVNPKLGITYSNRDLEAYLSYSQSNHEPSRDDFEAGASDQPRPERLHDFELGLKKKGDLYSWGATAYYMLYRDQLVLTGKINDVGGYTRTNIPNSYRLGIELQGTVTPANWFSAEANLTLSQNKVLNYTEYDFNYDINEEVSFAYRKTDIAFSPSVIGAATLNFTPLPRTRFSLLNKYVSKEYLDNAQQEGRRLDGYFVGNLRAVYILKPRPFNSIDLIFQLNNIFNGKYVANGYTYSSIYGGRFVTENFLFPMATRNFMMAVNIKL